jgi:hypothetical protein
MITDGLRRKIRSPKSCVEDPDRFDEGDEGMTVLVTERIAREKGIEV